MNNEIKINPFASEMTSFIVMDILDRAKEMESKGIDVIHLEVGEPDFEPSECVKKACCDAMFNNQTHYTHSLGDIELRNSISSYYKDYYGINISPNQVVITSGSSIAIYIALLALAKADGEVLITNPGYACYKNFALSVGCKAQYIDVSDHTAYQLDIEEINRKINSKTVAIIINSPMNPTGTILSETTLKNLAELNIPIISDEIYHGLIYSGEKNHSILEYTNNSFVINGFSKKYAMTGLRLGYMIFPQEMQRLIQTIQQNLFLCAPSISQKAAISALNEGESDAIKRNAIYNERRTYMLEKLRSLGFIIETEPKGAFYIFANAAKFTNNSYQFAIDMLENAHVGITPGIDFGTNGEGYVRFSYANSIEKIKIGLQRIEEYLKKYKQI